MRKIALISFLFIFAFLQSRSQNVGIGADVMYNFQTESFGAGARVSLFPDNTVSFVPQFSYYFPFNKVHEYYIGLGIEYKVIRRDKFHLYAMGHGAYNSWINYNESSMNNAKLNNWNLEVGGGISTNKCLRPFLEYRYNFKFLETHLRLGLLYIFGCSGGGGSRKGGGGRHKVCPAYQ